MTSAAQVVPLHERRSSLPQDIARCILAGFDKHYRLFRAAAIKAKELYEHAAWPEMRALAAERIQMYDHRVQEAVDELLEDFPQAARDESLWPAIKLAYIPLLHEHKQPECAETFYNSVACAVLHRRHGSPATHGSRPGAPRAGRPKRRRSSRRHATARRAS